MTDNTAERIKALEQKAARLNSELWHVLETCRKLRNTIDSVELESWAATDAAHRVELKLMRLDRKLNELIDRLEDVEASLACVMDEQEQATRSHC